MVFVPTADAPHVELVLVMVVDVQQKVGGGALARQHAPEVSRKHVSEPPQSNRLFESERLGASKVGALLIIDGARDADQASRRMMDETEASKPQLAAVAASVARRCVADNRWWSR